MKMNPEQGTRSGFTRLDLNYRAASGCRGMGMPSSSRLPKHTSAAEHLRIMSHRNDTRVVSPNARYQRVTTLLRPWIVSSHHFTTAVTQGYGSVRVLRHHGSKQLT